MHETETTATLRNRPITPDTERKLALRRIILRAVNTGRRHAAIWIPEQPANVLVVCEGEEGYEVLGTLGSPEMARVYAEKLNQQLQITPAERDYLLQHAMFPKANSTPNDFLDAKPYSGTLKTQEFDVQVFRGSDPGNVTHYHVNATSEEEAIAKALQQADTENGDGPLEAQTTPR
ncbi:MAG TPA: hypothetical protein VNF68_07900 [Candidatus Baltobacteraceae bacterium]|nr:hypothetical protein [Candidatus Baltobacteraceae bacterium]